MIFCNNDVYGILDEAHPKHSGHWLDSSVELNVCDVNSVTTESEGSLERLVLYATLSIRLLHASNFSCMQ
jgi:hypothetical protein